MTGDSDPLRARAPRGHVLLGAGGLWLAALTAATLGTALGLRLVGLAATVGRSRVDGLVELGVVAAGVVVLAWLALSCSVAAGCVTARATGAGWRRGEAWVQRWAPVVVRRAVVVALGAALGLSAATGASAADATPTASAGPAVSATVATGTATAAHDLGWVPTESGAATVPSGTPTAGAPAEQPVEAQSPLPSPSASRAPESAAPAVGAARTVSAPSSGPAHAASVAARDQQDAAAASTTITVAPGDTLWGITARQLPAGAARAQIAAAWPALYAANAATIGSEPDMIRPGQVLSIPADLGGAAS